MRSPARAALYAAIAVAATAWSMHASRARAAREPDALVERALGPLTDLAAGVEWVRADLALRAGREDLYHARAERALALHPSDTQGWIDLAHHLVLERASPQRHLEGDVRRHWIEAGLALLERGEASAADPAELVFDRGLLLTYLAKLAPEDRAWPASEEEARRLAREAFERAAALGHAEAAEVLRALSPPPEGR